MTSVLIVLALIAGIMLVMYALVKIPMMISARSKNNGTAPNAPRTSVDPTSAHR